MQNRCTFADPLPGIGVEWAETLLGIIAVLFIPLPFAFIKYGKSIRAKSKFAPALDIKQDKARDEESRGSDEEDSTGNTNGGDKEKEVKAE